MEPSELPEDQVMVSTPSTPGHLPPFCIDNLPQELLCEIFIYWAYIDDDAAWMATTVSQQWRRIVLGCPRAWSPIYVSILPKQAVEEVDLEWCIEEDYLEWLASPRGKSRPLGLWLQRAGNTDISLSLRVACTAPLVEDRVAEITGTIEPYLGRMRHFSLVADTCLLEDALVGLFATKTSSWRTFHLALDPYLGRNRPSRRRSEVENINAVVLLNVWRSLDLLPDVQQLTFRGCLPAPQCHNPISSNRLTRLVIQDTASDNSRILKILSECKNLAELYLSCLPAKPKDFETSLAEPSDVDGPPPPLPQNTISLLTLTHLAIHKMTTDSCRVFFDRLHVPNLRQLSLWNNGLQEVEARIANGEKTYDIMAPFGEAVEAFASHTSRLESFHITSSLLPDRHLLGALEHLGALTELRLKYMNVGTPTFRGLARASVSSVSPPGKEAKPLLCPSLRHLAVIGCDFASGNQLLDVVQARNADTSLTMPISLLEVRRCRKVGQNDLQKLGEVDPGRLRIFASGSDVHHQASSG